MQQIIVSGVGGQGVLFVTKLLAEAALGLDYSVLISETHGMAQRGGNVISHLKVSQRQSTAETAPPDGKTQQQEFRFTSPLIRPGRAEVLLALHPEALAAHGFYLQDGGKVFCNSPGEAAGVLDASCLAGELGSPISANLVLLGFACGSGSLFCQPSDLEAILERLGGQRLEVNLRAFRAGSDEALKRLES